MPKEREKEENFMNRKIVSLVCCLLALMSVISVARAVPSGRPAMDNVLIHVYANPDAEFLDFELGTVELTDWPATKYWLDRWRIMPQISLRSYSELGMQEFDLNNQRWPCGWDTPKEYDARSDSYKHYMDLSDMTNINCRRDWCAEEFRKALRYLTDKDSYVRNILGGLGYAVESFVPYPALAGYTDYASLNTKGLIYWYNPATAEAVLNKAGFRDLDADGSRDDWQDPGPDLTWGTADDGAIEYNSLRLHNADGLVVYTRMDDPNRDQAGFQLCVEMQKLKIPVKIISTERTVCYRQVMVLYDYDIYTGGWSLGAIPDYLHTIDNSEFYWAPLGWASNYCGWCNKEYDAAAYAMYTAATIDDYKKNALRAQEIMANYTGKITLWCMAATKGFSTGYAYTVADSGYGTDNYYSFALMDDTRAGKDRTIDYGFKSDIEGLHVISSEWLWDWNAIGLVYEPLIGRKPYDKSMGSYDYWLATDYSIGTWGTEGYTEVNFTIRSDVVWQDGVPFTPDDVVFSLNFTRNCGKGVAWNFAGVQYLNKTWAEGNKVIVRMNVAKPLTGQEDPGFMPIIPKHIWQAKYPDWQSWYNEKTGTWSDARFAVRDWTFWTEPHPVYNATNPHPTNGVLTKAIGTGEWIYDSRTVGQYISFHANKMYYKTHESLLNDVKDMFWSGMGDANKNMKVDGPDLAMIHACWPPSAYDPDCDFNKDHVVDGTDHFITAKNYGRLG